MLAPAPLAASLTWTSDDPALGAAGLDGSLQARLPLGTLAGSPEFAFPVQLVHRFDHAVESRRNDAGEMNHTVTSSGYWEVPQLVTSLAPEGTDFLRWKQPGGGEVWFRTALLGREFNRAGATDWEIREAGSAAYEIRHRTEGLTYRYHRGQLVQVQSRFGRVLHITSRGGRIERIEQRAGAGTLLEAAYDQSGRLSSLTVGPMEHRFRWQEDAGALGIDYRGHGGRLLRWQAADGRSLDVRWQEVAAGHHVVSGLRSGGQERWSDFEWALHDGFDPADDREQVSQPVVLVADDRARYQVGRDNQGYRLARTDALGRTSTLRHHPVRGEVELRGPDGGGVTYSWRARRGGSALLRKVAAADGSTVVENLYDGDGRLLTRLQEGRPRIDYQRDDLGRVLAILRNDQPMIRFAYRGQGPDPVRVTNATGDSIRLDYDASGQVVRMTDWRGGDHRYIYDGLGRLLTHVHPMGYQREVRYDQWGRVTQMQDLDGSQVALRLDQQTGRVLGVSQRSVGGTRIEWGYHYDERGRLARLTRDGADWQSWQREPLADGGLKVTSINPLGHRRLAEFNADGALVAATDELGHTTTYEVNAGGELLGWQDARGAAVNFTRDRAGRVAGQSNAAGQQWSWDYDPMGRLIARDNGEQDVRYQWDDFGRLEQISYGMGQVVRLWRDDLSRVVEAVLENDGDEGVRTTLAYDGMDRVIARKQELPDGSVTGMAWSYNAAGDRETVALLRRDAEALGQGRAGFQQVGLALPAANDADADTFAQVTRYRRDLLGRITAVEVDGVERVRYHYDQRTLRLERKSFSDGVELRYAWDDMGRIAGMRLLRGTGDGTDETGEGIEMKTVTYRWDNMGRLVERRLTGFALDELTDDPRQADVATAMTVLQQRTIAQRYHYDPAGRLVRIESPQAPVLEEAWKHDASGNVIEHTRGSGDHSLTTVLTHDLANQVTGRRLVAADGSELDSVSFTYDKAGRLQRELDADGAELARYNYGFLDKVMNVSRGGQSTDFHYDPSGMLVGKQGAGDEQMEAWVWDGIALAMRGEQMFVNEPHASGGVPVLARAVGGDDGGVTSERLLLSDYLGTTLAAIDPASISGATGAALGDATAAESLLLTSTGTANNGAGEGTTTGDLARFTGKPYDADLGAWVFPFRNYRSDLGSWTSADPAGFPDGPNQHFYAPVPTLGIDPLGLCQAHGSTPTGESGLKAAAALYTPLYSGPAINAVKTAVVANLKTNPIYLAQNLERRTQLVDAAVQGVESAFAGAGDLCIQGQAFWDKSTGEWHNPSMHVNGLQSLKLDAAGSIGPVTVGGSLGVEHQISDVTLLEVTSTSAKVTADFRYDVNVALTLEAGFFAGSIELGVEVGLQYPLFDVFPVMQLSE